MKKMCPVYGCIAPALPWKWQHFGRCTDCERKGTDLADIYKRLIRLGHPAGEYRIPLKAFDLTHPGRGDCFGWGIRGVMLHPDIPYYQDLPLFGLNPKLLQEEARNVTERNAFLENVGCHQLELTWSKDE